MTWSPAVLDLVQMMKMLVPVPSQVTDILHVGKPLVNLFIINRKHCYVIRKPNAISLPLNPFPGTRLLRKDNMMELYFSF